MLAARSLVQDGDATAYAHFMVFWGLLFGVYGLVVGIQNESTRAVGSARQLARGSAEGTGVLAPAGLLSLGAAVLVLISSPWWGPRLTPDQLGRVVALVTLGVLLHGLYQAWLGSAAGLQEWSTFSWLMISDAALRLAFVVVATVLAGGLLGFQVACVAAGVGWLLLLVPTARGRRILRARTDVPARRYLRNCLLAMISSTSTAILVTAFPILIKLTSPAEDPAVLAGTITAISLTRSPILIPLQAFQGVAISAFLTRRQGMGRALARPVGLVSALGVVCALIAGLIGPWLLRVLFDPALVATHLTFGLLTLAAIPLAVLTLTGTASIAVNNHGWFSIGWFTAAVVSTLLLLLPFELPVRVCIGLMVGPLVGAAVHLVGIRAREGSARRQP